MQLTQNLGREIKDYISTLLGKDATVLSVDGLCISSPNDHEIGKKISIPKEVMNYNSSGSITINGAPRLLMPLEHDNEKVAFLLLNEDPEKARNYTSLIKSFAELLIQQYYENNKPVLDSTDQYIIKLLNNSSASDYPFYESEAKVLGYDFSVKRLAIVIHLKGFWEKCLLSFDQPSFERDEVIKNYKKNVEVAINSFFSKNNDIIIAYLGNDKFAVFKAVDNEDEKNVLKFLKNSYKSIFDPLKSFRIESFSVGFSNAYSGVAGLVTSFREADISLEMGQKLWGENKTYYFGDLGILSILGQGNREKNLQFANRLLNKMKNKELQKTLECFFEQNLNLTETAEEMGVHRNTIIYRLNQISKVLGADPRVFEQAMTIKMALLIRKLFGEQVVENPIEPENI